MKNIVLLVVLLLSVLGMQAQNYFTRPVEGYSMKKLSIITLNDSTIIEGALVRARYEEGLFTALELLIDEEKKEISVEDIAHAYIAQSGFDKLGEFPLSRNNIFTTIAKDVNEEYIKEGFAYFEKTAVIINNKKVIVLLQLLNPAFQTKIKVFHDPKSRESSTFVVEGIGVSGGHLNSYYIKIGDEPAYRIKKKDYKKEAPNLFVGCDGFYDSLGKKALKWLSFGETLMNYTVACGDN